MGGQEFLSNVAFYVSIAVVIGMAFMFAFLFAIYGFYKVRHIRYGHEDKKLEHIIKNRYKSIIKRRSDLSLTQIENSHKEKQPDYVLVQDLENVKTFTLIGEKEVTKVDEPTSVVEAILEEKKKSKKWRVVSNILFGVFYVLLLALLAVSIVFKINGQQLFFGNTSYIAIYTGSMETANEANEYLTENDLMDDSNRITQYSLIGIDKVEKEEDMKLYDIYAYKNPDGAIIVHRLIRIYTNPETGITTYTFRGDSNSVSLNYELLLHFDDIVGRYNGYQNFGLGVFVIYCQSSIGLIALIAAFLFLASFQITEHYIDEEYNKRNNKIAKEIDARPILYLEEKKKLLKKEGIA